MKDLKFLFLGILAVLVSACGKQTPTPAEVAAKIDAHQVLTEVDYSVIIDYCGDYAKTAQQYFNLINQQPSDSTKEYLRAAGELASLRAANPYLDIFQTVLYGADESQLGEVNVKKVNEYQKYQAFPLPDGAGPALTIPGEKGEIVAMPAESSSVIAEPEGEVF